MRKKIVFGMAIISLVAIIVLCQKAGVRRLGKVKKLIRGRL